MRLAGKIALVTGGLRGIGRAIADRFAAEGATVFLTDIEDEATAGHLLNGDTPIQYVQSNAANENDWADLVKTIEKTAPRLDCLVNNAGVDFVGAVEDTEMDAWRRVMSVNIDGAFLGVKHCHALLVKGGEACKAGSTIINVSSILGKIGYADTSGYNASKGALKLFSKAIAIEFATKKLNIRSNSLHPGFVHTPLLVSGMERAVETGDAENAQELIDLLATMTPMGRVADPAEIANCALFLASDESSYMTGSELVVDGGWTAQ